MLRLIVKAILFCYAFVLLRPLTVRASDGDNSLRIYMRDGRYFLELHPALLGRDILAVSRIARGAANAQTLIWHSAAGEKVNENLLRFEKDSDGKVFLLDVDLSKRSTDSSVNGMYAAVQNAAMQPVAAVFDLKPAGSIGGNPAIDITSLITGDNDLIFFNQAAKAGLSLGMFQADKSSIIELKSLASYAFIKTLRTYGGANGGTSTVELGTTLMLLPRQPMHPRVKDERVGYFATDAFTDFDQNTQGTASVQYVTRWRLEPKPADVQRYLKGELVEPQRPIVFYIDPATPKKWVPWFIKGVNDWQQAFERAGFKNAIYAKPAPTKMEDSAWRLESAAYSNMVYMALEDEDASYSTVTDPRSGEILESHIRWYHNELNRLFKWYFVQTSPSDPRARKMQYDDELMGELVRYIIAHEVGHALGLPHNFIASNSTPVQKLRDRQWLEANGHTCSIMDYARFNYVAQPQDKVSPKGLFPRIGEYDKWAIEWGYRWLPDSLSRQRENDRLNDWIQAHSKDPRYRYGGQGINADPRSQSEDLSNDVLRANEYGVQNLTYITSNLQAWTGGDEGMLKILYDEVFSQYFGYMIHAADHIGGLYEWTALERKDAKFAPVPKKVQKEALEFLQRNLFSTPQWILNQRILDATGESGLNKLSIVQSKIISNLLLSERLGNLLQSGITSGDDAYNLSTYLQDLNKLIWPEAFGTVAADAYRRNLQLLYLDNMERFLQPGPNQRMPRGIQSDLPAILRSNLRQLKAGIEKSLSLQKDAATLAHLQFAGVRIDNCLAR